MKQAIRLLLAIGRGANGIANLITAFSLAAWLYSAALEATSRWFHSSPGQQLEEQLPLLNAEEQALLTQVQQFMEMQYQISALRREILTLPPLPEEGY
jgi:hypothetical protein